MARSAELRRLRVAAVLGAAILFWLPRQVLAWSFECHPESAQLCRSSGPCEYSALYGNGFRFADGIIQICNLGRCSRESRLWIHITDDTVSASSTAMTLSVQRKTGYYSRQYVTARGMLMERGKCGGG